MGNKNFSHNEKLLVPQQQIIRMLKNAQTKIIFPVITYGLLREFVLSGKKIFSDHEIREAYYKAVKIFHKELGHQLHIGGKYYDAYPVRNLPKYEVLQIVEKDKFELTEPYCSYAEDLLPWIVEEINKYVTKKLGLIPKFKSDEFRLFLAKDKEQFLTLLNEYINTNATNFEIFSFAILKVHLEKFACKIYRDTRTSARDSGVDLSTNFGVVYQIKKMKIRSAKAADQVYSELKSNFDRERVQQGNVIVIIDDISNEAKNYLVDMKIQSIKKSEIMQLAEQMSEVEERMKVLRIIYEEFEREYGSDLP